MVLREREAALPSWTSVIFADTACSSSCSSLFFFLIPFSLKLPFCPLCHGELKNPEFCDREAVKDVEGTESARRGHGSRPRCHRRRLTFLKEREELPLVTALVSEACFRAATSTGPHKTRRLNIPPLITPTCQGFTIGARCQRFNCRGGGKGLTLSQANEFTCKIYNAKRCHFIYLRSYP